jgi:hypothetical protein
MNAAQRKQASAVPAIIVRKDELERFLDDMWVSINQAQATDDNEK